MKSKKGRDVPEACGNAPGTDDDIYLPVCCGEFGLRQAADLRELWEATWSQDRRGRDTHARDIMQPSSNGHAPEREEDSTEG